MRTKLLITDDKLKDLEKLSASVNHDEDRIIVSDHFFFSDELVLTIADKYTGKEAKVKLEAHQVCDMVDEFVNIPAFVENPGFWWLKDLATSTARNRLFKEFKDILLFKVSPINQELKVFG